MPSESLKLFLQIQRIEPQSHFLAMTTEPERMTALTSEAGLPSERVSIVSVSHDEVPAYLAAADVGLLLREPSPVNAVASPVKFGEYLASGAAVIMSDNIGDYSDLARSEQVGLVLQPHASEDQNDTLLRSFIDAYRRAPETWRDRCRHVAGQNLDSGVHVGRIADAYRSLSEGRPKSPGVIVRPDPKRTDGVRGTRKEQGRLSIE
jgi:hypothetical protein